MSKFVNPFNPEGRATPANKPALAPNAPGEVPSSGNIYKTWVDVYKEFLAIVDQVLTSPDCDNHCWAHVVIDNRVMALYAQHEGEPLWDAAYERWIEPSDDDPEIN